MCKNDARCWMMPFRRGQRNLVSGVRCRSSFPAEDSIGRRARRRRLLRNGRSRNRSEGRRIRWGDHDCTVSPVCAGVRSPSFAEGLALAAFATLSSFAILAALPPLVLLLMLLLMVWRWANRAHASTFGKTTCSHMSGFATDGALAEVGVRPTGRGVVPRFAADGALCVSTFEVIFAHANTFAI